MYIEGKRNRKWWQEESAKKSLGRGGEKTLNGFLSARVVFAPW